MLRNLRIQNFALIEDMDIDFTSGLSILLGETGAGKSIIIEALGLLKGTKSTFSKIRDESKNAVIEGTFSFDSDYIAAHPALEEYLGGEREIVVSRVMTPNKTTKARVNGITVSLTELKELMDRAVDIHSQGENYALFDESRHIEFLDSFDPEGVLNVAKTAYQAQYRRVEEVNKELASLYEAVGGEDREYLEFQLAEIERFYLEPDEIEEMEAEIARADGFEDIKDAYGELQEILSSENGFQSLLSAVKRAVRQLTGTSLSGQALTTIEKLGDFEEALSELVSCYDDLDFDPEHIERLNQRLFDLGALRSKYGRKTYDILAAYDRYSAKLSEIDSFELDREGLEKRIAVEEGKLEEMAGHLHACRQQAARALETATNAELEDLGLLSGGFKVEISTATLSFNGHDKVRFLLALNRGSRYIALKEAASGGENSRLMLALKSLFNRLQPYGTVVFDEIDTGISGKIASMVGAKIKSIAKTSQTIVITHLPQVAGKGQHHYLVTKGVNDKGVTVSNILKIEGEQVVLEIAKMMSGADVTESAIEASRELVRNS